MVTGTSAVQGLVTRGAGAALQGTTARLLWISCRWLLCRLRILFSIRCDLAECLGVHIHTENLLRVLQVVTQVALLAVPLL